MNINPTNVIKSIITIVVIKNRCYYSSYNNHNLINMNGFIIINNNIHIISYKDTSWDVTSLLTPLLSNPRGQSLQPSSAGPSRSDT